MAPLIVTVDTSTPAGSVALSRGPELLGEVLLHLRGTHTDRVLGSLQWLLAEAQVKLAEVEAFGVVVGPGSFTGLRVGVATVKGLAYASGASVVGVSSLETLAAACPSAAYPVCSIIDARKSEVYAAVFDCRSDMPAAVTDEQVLAPKSLLQQLQGEHLFVGSGALLYRDLISAQLGSRAHFAPMAVNLPRASSAAGLVWDRLQAGRTTTAQALVPCYIRASEAEIMRASQKSS
ncbi:nucleoid maintenance protease YeaZ [Syntrophotalea carbinolica DSM 2380]|uniref:Nucleoid maintenance protease YeaZ n=1 Tax=Syntrophotalea carbinolica (strain DSM 2380 / NBRC 103641 / GraBd1) TaxID=338963 RepID=Q3A3A3_SYNC1|nr:tRNA (adenosine(37)-N6)-threonylcarbamoyltransferase complex dimerization subunit type 1 TsaB [Syntrophotalea carbinolica]ABA89154.1 nucleoid maintenance protease YeaZ [Syntrophotalea carbinolica DSM 2380]